MDCIVHGVTKSRTRLSKFHSHFSTPNPRLEDPNQSQIMLAYLWVDGELITSPQNHFICLLDNNDCIEQVPCTVAGKEGSEINMGHGDTEARTLFMFEPWLLLPLPNSAWPLTESLKLSSFIGNGHHNACLVRSWEDCWGKLKVLVLHARSILSWGAGAVPTAIFFWMNFSGAQRS